MDARSKNKRLHFNYDNDIMMQITNEDISNLYSVMKTEYNLQMKKKMHSHN